MSNFKVKGGREDISLIGKNVIVTNHFANRWNERVLNGEADEGEALADVEKKLAYATYLKNLTGDYYILFNYLIIADENEGKVHLITVLGEINRCERLISYLIENGPDKLGHEIKKYGKLPLI